MQNIHKKNTLLKTRSEGHFRQLFMQLPVTIASSR